MGDPVIQSHNMLSVELGPGLLGKVYDGLQAPLPELALRYGTFLPRGVELSALDKEKKWSFSSNLKSGDSVVAGDTVGVVQEGKLTHKIMVPFDWDGEFEILWIQEGNFKVDDTIARLKNTHGHEESIKLSTRWPVRRPLSRKLYKHNYSQRIFPSEPLITGQRLVDSFFPIARGGIACIPGPFGAGKTVLQNLLARHSSVDVVVIVACGERAGEVVETIYRVSSIV